MIPLYCGGGALRIAQVAPLYESVPPRLYGGTERVVYYLTEELVRRGHQVTLFASGDSRTSARLEAACPAALRLDPSCDDPLPHHVLLLERVAARAHGFDVVHFHTEYLHFPLARRLGVPTVTTLHGRLDLSDYAGLFREFGDLALVSVSEAQRRPLPWVNWVATVHHGLPAEAYRPGDGRGGYLAFLGRMSPEKRPDLAIRIARRAGIPLKMAAKVDRADREYFEAVVRPLLREPQVEFLGEIRQEEKGRFLGDALALLFPIDWPEPFGLVMVEALACGTPVVAFRRGSVPEVLEDGVTGFVVDDPQGAVAAVERVARLDRRRCRQAFEERFTAERMAQDYLEVYRRLQVGYRLPPPEPVVRSAA